MKATNTHSYLIIGSGRVARHLGYYLHLLDQHFETWDRSQDPHALGRKVAKASHVLLALSDSALLGFFRQHLAGHDKTVVHFSGAHHFDGMIAAHPLMTFGPELYDLEFYKKIHFVVTGAATLQEALPVFTNPFSVLSAQEKSLYHAYCVLGGNFVTLLISKMLQGFSEMGIPAEAASLYLEKVLANTVNNPAQALTGPLVRKDIETVKANLQALSQDSYRPIYEAFLKTHWPEYPRK
ncbi:MAG: hypothetical protein OM95_07655 [Bdellovibrio sp. ArHS]|uniref:DUF2520 domain-containing protein n=1 Tax=Bdellovibrio sp. ArHS TaxID=1569284 RepID=UPI000582E25B|nr:DUF2520 domain-containing protein [Bdellovibrio sp. ArHS]KHD88672.1 MAG: hypothetical protein OM95_07655 [Bdellovibrio sp. ArHS]